MRGGGTERGREGQREGVRGEKERERLCVYIKGRRGGVGEGLGSDTPRDSRGAAVPPPP